MTEKSLQLMIRLKQNISVIMCTGYSKNISDEMVIETGINAFAYIPIVKADLAKKVQKELEENRAS